METHEILQKYLKQKQASSDAYSIRAIARRLGVSASFLSRILSGKRPIPYTLLLKMRTALDIAPEVFASLKEAHEVKLEGAAPARGKRRVDTPLEDWEMASQQSVQILRAWYFLPVLQCVSLEDFDGKVSTLVRRLGLRESIARSACEELKELGLLDRRNGLYSRNDKKLRWDSAKSVKEVRKFHGEMLARAQAELDRSDAPEDFTRRLITGITVSTNPAKIEAAKKRLAECLHEIANEMMDSESSTEVFHLAAQLFPLTLKK